MPYRSTALVWAVFGSVLVLALILLGRDLSRAVRTGPGWKRKLVAAGLVLLGAFGWTTAGCGPIAGPGDLSSHTSTDFGDPIPPATALTDTKHWGHLTAVWREAEEIGSGRRGDYPFDEKGKKQIQDQLAVAATNIDRLRAANLLGEAEAGLLAKELSLLTSRVAAKRPTELRMATCYEPMAFTPAHDSLARLTDRLPLLERLAAAKAVHPQVMNKVLDTVEKDIAVLGQQQMRDQLPEQQKAEAERVAREARSQVEKLRDRVESQLGSLEERAEWGEITAAWKEAVPLATSGRSTTAQRESVDRKLDAAKRTAGELAAAGLLSKAEAWLLVSEAERLKGQIYRNPPTDSQVTCYDMAFLPPAHQSFEQLNRRLPLLRQLASGGRVNPAALEKVLGSIEADIKTLADDKALEQLEPQRRAEAKRLQADAQSAVDQIKALLKDSE